MALWCYSQWLSPGRGGKGPAFSDFRPVHQSGKSTLTSYSLGGLSKPLPKHLLFSLQWPLDGTLLESLGPAGRKWLEKRFLANRRDLPSFYHWLTHVGTRTRHCSGLSILCRVASCNGKNSRGYFNVGERKEFIEHSDFLQERNGPGVKKYDDFPSTPQHFRTLLRTYLFCS